MLLEGKTEQQKTDYCSAATLFAPWHGSCSFYLFSWIDTESLELLVLLNGEIVTWELHWGVTAPQFREEQRPEKLRNLKRWVFGRGFYAVEHEQQFGLS